MAKETHSWEKFFDGHAPDYMENPFTKNTVEEVDYILKELDISPGSLILDIGCGTGRHSIELAKRGMEVTGIDISTGMLAEAQKAAKDAGVDIEFVKADASQLNLNTGFDAAICLCEGAFSLLSTGDDPIEHDLNILRNIYNGLNTGGGFILTCLSAFKMIRQYSNEDVTSGKFDPLNLTEKSDVDNSAEMRERGYVPTELRLLFGMAGFEIRHIWGGTAGNWGERLIDLDEYEIMVVARKP